VGFFGLVDVGTGRITDPGHPLRGRTLAGHILVFPRAKGSTVGSYTLYALARSGTGPAGMIVGECEAVVAAGAVMAGIPTVDQIDIEKLKGAGRAVIEGEEIRLA
jgi:predicted aconitase with swiveling domain